MVKCPCDKVIYLYLSPAMTYDTNTNVLSTLKKHASEQVTVGVLKKGSALHKHLVNKVNM